MEALQCPSFSCTTYHLYDLGKLLTVSEPISLPIKWPVASTGPSVVMVKYIMHQLCTFTTKAAVPNRL